MTKTKRRRFQNDTCRLEMTPMIDVTFLLLIFFMCTLKFKTLEGTLGAYLPKDVGTASHPEQPTERLDVRLDVLSAGSLLRPLPGGATAPYTAEDARLQRRFVHGDDRLIRYAVGPFVTTDRGALVERLQAVLPEVASDGRRVTVDARVGITQAEVVYVVDALTSLDVDGITFAGSRER